MNKDQVKGEAIDIADKIQEEAGKIDWQAQNGKPKDCKSRLKVPPLDHITAAMWQMMKAAIQATVSSQIYSE